MFANLSAPTKNRIGYAVQDRNRPGRAFSQREHVTDLQPIEMNGCGYYGNMVFTIAGCPGAEGGGRNDSGAVSIDGVEMLDTALLGEQFVMIALQG